MITPIIIVILLCVIAVTLWLILETLGDLLGTTRESVNGIDCVVDEVRVLSRSLSWLREELLDIRSKL